MIRYKCDWCGKENLKKFETTIINKFPRLIRTYVKDAAGAKLLPTEKADMVETHLCMICCSKLARIFPIIEED